MKKLSLSRSPLVLVLSSIILFSSCKKINEATELGDNLVPEVDNVNTFETSFDTETNSHFLTDTTTLTYSERVVLGTISNDPEFGATNASVFFSISAPGTNSGTGTNGTYPFTSRDNLEIDSVVLSLSYTGAYGDSSSLQTVRVYEMAPTSGFSDTVGYKFSQPEFETSGAELGSKTIAFNTLKDSITIIRKDTVRTANVMRIHLDKALGYRLSSFDTTNTVNGGFYNDSLFKKLFRGLAIKTDAGMGNGLAFFDLTDAAKTNLTVYYKAVKAGVKDTASAVFSHIRNGQANSIQRTPAGNYAAYLNNGSEQDELLYLQSTPGSYASIKIPSLDTFSNNVIHRAELIVTRVPSVMDAVFTPPTQLFLDKVNNNKDSAFTLENDFMYDVNSGSNNLSQFGGRLRSDQTYRFNITGHVQGIITRKDPNLTLRLYAPYFTEPYMLPSKHTFSSKVEQAHVFVAQQPAKGRVVLAGGNYTDPSLRMRVRIVYSKI